MITYNQSSVAAVAGAADLVFALLQIIASPEAAKKHLADMRAILEDAGRDAARLEAEARGAELDQRSTALDDRERKLDQRERALDQVAEQLRVAEAAAAAKAARIRSLISGEPLAA